MYVFRKVDLERKKVIACDMDKTVIKIETIDLIGEKILKNNAISANN